MSRKIWIGLVIAGVFFVLLAAAGAVGYMVYDRQRTADALATAEQAYANRDWQKAWIYYQHYLSEVPGDTKALLKFAEACEKRPINRPKSLYDAAVAYQQCLEHLPQGKEYQPQKLEVTEKLIKVYERMLPPSWIDVQHWVTVSKDEGLSDPLLSYHLALANEQLGAVEDAENGYRELIAQNTDHADVYTRLAGMLRARSQLDDAEKVITDALAARPKDVTLRLEAHRYYQKNGAAADAARMLDEAATLAPEDPKVLLAQAQQAAQEPDLAKAIELSERAYAVDPKSPEIAVELAKAYWRTDKPSDAAEVLQTLESLERAENHTADLILAELLYTIRRTEEAEKIVKEYFDAFPKQGSLQDYFTARQLLVADYKDDEAKKTAMNEAIELLTLVVEQRPDFPVARYQLALAQLNLAMLKKEDKREGCATLGVYVRLNPEDDSARTLYRDNCQIPSSEEAEREVEKTLARTDASAEDFLNAIRLKNAALEREGKPISERVEELRELFETAIERYPKVPEAYRGLAEILVTDGKAGEARDVLARAREAGVPEEELYRAEANIVLEAGKVDEARSLFDRDVARPDTSLQRVLEWVDLLESKRQPDLVSHALETASTKFGASDGAKVEVRRAEASSRLDDTDKALEAIRTATARAQGASAGDSDRRDMETRLQNATLEVARRLLLESDEGDADRAKKLVNEVLSTNPDHPTALALDAQMLLNQKPPQWNEARVRLERIAKRDPGNAVALLGLSKIEANEGNVAGAMQHAEDALRAAPRSVPAALQMAALLNNATRDYLRTQTLLKPIVEAQPDNGTALQLYIESLLGGEKTEEADRYLAQLEQLAANNPKYAPAAATLRARVLMATNASGEATEVLRAQYEKNPDDFTAVLNYATVLLEQRKEAEVEAIYRAYTDKHSDNVQAWVKLAQLYAAVGTPESLGNASNALTRALLSDPNDKLALKEMLRVQARRGEVGEALRYCGRYLEQESNDPDVLAQQAILLWTQRRLPEALQSVQKAIDLSDRLEYLAIRGIIYLDTEEYAKAQADLLKVENGPRPPSADVDLALAQINLTNDKIDEAKQYLARAKSKLQGDQSLDPVRLKKVEEDLSRKEGKA